MLCVCMHGAWGHTAPMLIEEEAAVVVDAAAVVAATGGCVIGASVVADESEGRVTDCVLLMEEEDVEEVDENDGGIDTGCFPSS